MLPLHHYEYLWGFILLKVQTAQEETSSKNSYFFGLCLFHIVKHILLAGNVSEKPQDFPVVTPTLQSQIFYFQYFILKNTPAGTRTRDQ